MENLAFHVFQRGMPTVPIRMLRPTCPASGFLGWIASGIFLFILLSFSMPAAVAATVPKEEATPLSAADFGTYTRAFVEVKEKRWKKALVLASLAHNPLPAEAIRWLYYTQPGTGASFDEIANFLREHPDWPNQRLLRQRAEEAMPGNLPDDAIRTWFSDQPPVTTRGRVLLGEALLRRGDQEAAEKHLRETWIHANFTRQEERQFLAKHRDLLDKADHAARLDRLLWNDRAAEAQRMLYRVDPDIRSLALARISLMRMDWDVDGAVQRVPKYLQSHAGLQYERLRWRRRKGKLESAQEILEHPPTDLIRPDLWWVERIAVSRHLFQKGYYSEAYRLTSNHGLEAGEAFAEAEWLSGWIALRFLKDAEVAFGHFTKLHEASRYPISRARGAYWAARAAEAIGARSAQAHWYQIASQYLTTYYGQLAVERVAGHFPLPPASTPKPTMETAQTLEANPLTQIVRLLNELGEKKYIRPFLLQLASKATTEEAYAWIADLAHSLARPDLAIAVTKQAQRANIPLLDQGYPILDLPDVKPEPALILAMTRQESELNQGAISSAGAHGLMQILPQTARSVSRSLRLHYSQARLLNDPVYNLQIGSAYLDQMLTEFNGSYILALAAYNAGPSRVHRWIREYGRPGGESDTDTIDWIESIPIYETRNYVQRIFENLQIYRLKLNGGNPALRISDDLRR